MPKVLPRSGSGKADAPLPQPQAAQTPEATYYTDSSETSPPSGAVMSDCACPHCKGGGRQARSMRERACAYVGVYLNLEP
jgi:hypothetical protein